MDNASGAVLVSTNAERTEAGFGARARARASRRAGSATARARGMEAHPRVSGNAARVLDDRPGPPGGARLETYLTALRPRADMCDARPDDAASAPTRAVREVDEPAVYPDTARHVVAVAIAPPAEHDMSVGTRIRRERAPRFALDSLSQSPSVRDSSPRAASSSPRRFTRSMWARNRLERRFGRDRKNMQLVSSEQNEQKNKKRRKKYFETDYPIPSRTRLIPALNYSSDTESSTANPAATPPSSLVAAFVRSRWPPCALRVTVSPTRTYPP